MEPEILISLAHLERLRQKIVHKRTILKKISHILQKRLDILLNFLNTSHFNTYKPIFSIQNKKAVSKIANVITTTHGLTFNN